MFQLQAQLLRNRMRRANPFQMNHKRYDKSQANINRAAQLGPF